MIPKITESTVYSILGNNSSYIPLAIKDVANSCGLTTASYIAGDKVEGKDRFIDEFGTEAIWLGGIPLTEKFADKYITKKGFNPGVNLKLFKEEQTLGKDALQGIEYNINKFKNIKSEEVQKAIADLIKVKENKSAYEKLLTKKFAAATIIPTVIMGFVLPKLNFALTRKIRQRKAENKLVQNNTPQLQTTAFTSFDKKVFNDFANKQNSKNINFTGSLTAGIANLRTIDKMAISDGGLTVGRVSTSRNKEEGYMNAFRMIGSMILNFVTPVYIAKGLDKLANKLFKVNVNLDPLIMENKAFIDAIKANKIELPKSNSAKDLLEFIDSKPDAFFSKFAQKAGEISYLKDGIRDPRKYVDIKKLGKFKDEFEKFIQSAKKSKNIEKFARKAKFIKCGNILANVGISSFLLAGVLPVLTYKFVKLTTGSYSDPGLVVKK